MKKYLIPALAVLLFASCNNNNYVKTKSGLLYKYAKKGSGPKVKVGQIVKLQYSQKVGDSLVASSFESGLPAYARVDSVGAVYNLLEVFPMMHKGDSIVVVEIGDTLQRKGLLPPYMKQSDKRTWSLRVDDVFDSPDAVEKDRAVVLENYKKAQTAVFDKYMAGKKANCKETPGGVYVDVETPGTGQLADTGKLAIVKYTGKFMPSEKVFESTITTPGAQPYAFVVGTASAIPGWDEGLQYFGRGGKGKLYVPYQMAYNDRPGPGGLPFQNLIFDIEVMDVQDAPKQEPGTMMPPQVIAPDTTRKK